MGPQMEIEAVLQHGEIARCGPNLPESRLGVAERIGGIGSDVREGSPEVP
jgi:hypothetical protein